MHLYVPQAVCRVWPDICCVLVPDGQSVQVRAFVPEPKVFAGHGSQALLLSELR